MKREALVLDDLSDATVNIVNILVENGFSVHLITRSERADRFLAEPIYIHVFGDLPTLATILSDIDLGNVEVALLLSPNDEINLMLARMLREKGVPRVVVVVRGSEKAEMARELGVDVVDLSHYITTKIQRLLSLKFAKITPISRGICMLEMLITGDSRILGATIRDLEEKYDADIVVIREERLVKDPDSALQAGDYLVAVGPITSLNELLKNA